MLIAKKHFWLSGIWDVIARSIKRYNMLDNLLKRYDMLDNIYSRYNTKNIEPD